MMQALTFSHGWFFPGSRLPPHFSRPTSFPRRVTPVLQLQIYVIPLSIKSIIISFVVDEHIYRLVRPLFSWFFVCSLTLTVSHREYVAPSAQNTTRRSYLVVVITS